MFQRTNPLFVLESGIVKPGAGSRAARKTALYDKLKDCRFAENRSADRWQNLVCRAAGTALYMV
jgi:hypothetical protein